MLAKKSISALLTPQCGREGVGTGRDLYDGRDTVGSTSMLQSKAAAARSASDASTVGLVSKRAAAAAARSASKKLADAVRLVSDSPAVGLVSKKAAAAAAERFQQFSCNDQKAGGGAFGGALSTSALTRTTACATKMTPAPSASALPTKRNLLSRALGAVLLTAPEQQEQPAKRSRVGTPATENQGNARHMKSCAQVAEHTPQIEQKHEPTQRPAGVSTAAQGGAATSGAGSGWMCPKCNEQHPAKWAVCPEHPSTLRPCEPKTQSEQQSAPSGGGQIILVEAQRRRERAQRFSRNEQEAADASVSVCTFVPAKRVAAAAAPGAQPALCSAAATEKGSQATVKLRSKAAPAPEQVRRRTRAERFGAVEDGSPVEAAAAVHETLAPAAGGGAGAQAAASIETKKMSLRVEAEEGVEWHHFKRGEGEATRVRGLISKSSSKRKALEAAEAAEAEGGGGGGGGSGGGAAAASFHPCKSVLLSRALGAALAVTRGDAQAVTRSDLPSSASHSRGVKRRAAYAERRVQAETETEEEEYGHADADGDYDDDAEEEPEADEDPDDEEEVCWEEEEEEEEEDWEDGEEEEWECDEGEEAREPRNLRLRVDKAAALRLVKHGIGKIPPPDSAAKKSEQKKEARQRVKARADQALYVARGRGGGAAGAARAARGAVAKLRVGVKKRRARA